MAEKKTYELWSGTKGWSYCYASLQNQSIPAAGKDGWFGYITNVPNFATSATEYYNSVENSDISSLITYPNNSVPFQLFTLPEDSTVEFTVIGASGGYCSLGVGGSNKLNPETGERILFNNGSWVNLGGRGGKIIASGKFPAGTKFLCGIGLMGFSYGNGSSSATPTLQGSGGGASVIFLVDDGGEYPIQNCGSITRVTPLVIAGGGGGAAGAIVNQNGDGGDAIVSNGENTNAGNKIQTISGYNIYAGTGAGLDNVGSYTGYYGTTLTAQSITSGKPACSGHTQSRAGGWPAGGGTGWNSSTINSLSNLQKQNSGAGGGGGYSGGNVNNYIGFGGTSYVHPSLKVISRGYPTYADGGLHPQCRCGGISITLGGGRDTDKLILAHDSQGYKYFNGVELGEAEDENNPPNNTWELIPNLTGEPQPDTYTQYGKYEITSFNGLEQNSTLLMMHKNANDKINIDAYVNSTILKQTKPISVSDVSEFLSLESNSSGIGVDIRFALSKDQGLTWQTYQIGGNWINIDINDKVAFATNGYPLASLNIIPIEDFNLYAPKTIMLALCITQTDESSGSIFKSLSYVANLVGSWRHYKEDEAEYEYVSDTELKVKFLKSGNYKVNYLDSLNASSD